MKRFLQEYWIWILAPFVFVIGGILVLYFMAGGEGTSPFIYNLF